MNMNPSETDLQLIELVSDGSITFPADSRVGELALKVAEECERLRTPWFFPETFWGLLCEDGTAMQEWRAFVAEV
jgi:hypothetical protein